MKRIFILLATLSLAACIDGVFESIDIPDGTQGAAASQTVNGSIRVGDDVTVTSGTFRSVNGAATIGSRSVVPAISVVNGAIRVGEDSRTGALATVNGTVSVGARSVVDGDLESVNGLVTLAERSRVNGKAVTVNGQLRLDSAHVAGNVENHNGGMRILGSSVVEGDLIVRRSQGVQFNLDEVPEVEIGADARVLGTLRFERDVRLYIHRGAEVGPIEGAEPEWLGGDEDGADTGGDDDA